ncbi:MAG: RnfABCDGE type electron transport complex subunit G [Cellulosilyticaceae bacterium]
MKETLKLGAVLFCITAVCSGLLGLVNSVTKPLIAERKQMATTEAIQRLIPEADDVISIDGDVDAGILEIYNATQNDMPVGTVVKVIANGYGDVIEMLVGVDLQQNVTGVEILSHAETPGLGANLEKPEFIEQFVGKIYGIDAKKGTSKDNEISAITGATITSQAVVDGVNQALEYVANISNDVFKGGN